MSSSAPLLSGTIEPDEDLPPTLPQGKIGASSRPSEPVVLVPGTTAQGSNSNITGIGNAEEGGIVS